MRKRIRAVAALLLCVCSLFMCMGKNMVYADNSSAENPFSGEVGLLKQDNGNYVMQVTVENSGADFTGTVQVIFAGTGRGNCAYNTEITLPAQGRKQFTITVTDRAAETVRGLCTLNFLNEKGELIQSISLKNVFGNTTSGFAVGILSDHYSSLTYLDAGGQDFYIQDMSYPLKLVELNQENLMGYLDGLYFLIIDQFNVSSLSQENIQAIQAWVEGGGWLIIGTGAYAEQTLSGFDPDFLKMEVTGISEPGKENTLSVYAGQYGDYYGYTEAEVDFTHMAVAELDYDYLGGYYESASTPAVCASVGEGAVEIYFFSLGEKELQKLEDYAVAYMYQEVMYQSGSYRYMDNYSDLNYVGQEALALIDKRNTDVDFSFLKVLIGVYVVLVGPVLYLVLRKCRRSEWYWLGVPVLGFLFIAGVFFLGRGARVNETTVYSVTVQRADSNREETYFLAYHSGTKAWEMHLRDSYEVAGPGWSGYRYYSSSSDTSDYFYTVSNDSQGLAIGIKPDENFDSGFLYAGGRTEEKGTLSAAALGLRSNITGTVINDTPCDLAYMAVWGEDYIMVFSDVMAGEAVDLQQACLDGRCVYQGTADEYEDLLYSMVSLYSYYYTQLDYEQDDMAALLIGLGMADEARPAYGEYAVIAGVVRNYEKAVTDKCNETSYGCLYSYAEMEVEQDAAN